MIGINEKTAPPEGHTFRLMRWNNNQRDVEVVLSPDQTAKSIGEGTHWHFHQAFELTYYRSGRGTHFVGDYIGPYGEGDVVLFGENLPHAHEVRGASSGLVLHWDFPLNHPFWAFPETRVLQAISAQAERGIRFGGNAGIRLRHLFDQIEQTAGFVQLANFFQLIAVLTETRESDKTLLSSNLFSLPYKSSHVGAIQEIIRYVAINFRNEIALEHVLQLAKMSKATFSRQFRKHTGKTLTEFAQDVRLSAVCRELTGTDLQVTEIALQNGFSEISFFNRVFQRKLGCSPSVYRQRSRAAEAKPRPAPIRV